MALVKFHLHHKRNGMAIIRLQYLCEDGTYYVESMKEKIKIGHWKKREGRLIPSAKQAGSINRYLDTQQERIQDAVRRLRGVGKKVTRDALRRELTGQIMDFWEYFDSHIAAIPPGGSDLSTHRTLYAMLREIEKQRGVTLDFRLIDQGLADSLTTLMRAQDYADSTIKTAFAKFNRLLSKAKKKKIISEYEPLTTPAKDIDHGAVYTTPDEIRMMLAVAHAYHLPGRARKVATLRKVAFMYALGTQLGLRSIDLNVSRENYVLNDKGEFLDMKNQKTSTSVLIPLSPLAKMILVYFKWKRPNFSADTFRNYIPTIAMYAGLNETSIHRTIVNGEIVETVYKKYEMVELHTMRRSWATNLVESGAPVRDIMKAGGWKTEASFWKYVRTSARKSAEQLAKFL